MGYLQVREIQRVSEARLDAAFTAGQEAGRIIRGSEDVLPTPPPRTGRPTVFVVLRTFEAFYDFDGRGFYGIQLDSITYQEQQRLGRAGCIHAVRIPDSEQLARRGIWRGWASLQEAFMYVRGAGYTPEDLADFRAPLAW